MLRENLERVRERIARACLRSGRKVEGITLVAVTKTVPADHVAPLAGLGCLDLGENRVREALGKIEALDGRGFTWHLVGHLQRNKARSVPGRFAWIH